MLSKRTLFRVTCTAALTLTATQALSQNPDLSVTNAEFVGGARVGACNTLRVAVRNAATTPVQTDFAVAYSVVLEGPTHFPATMHGGIGGNTTKAMSFSNVPYWGPGLPTGIIVDYSQNSQTGVVAEANESNNTFNLVAPKAGYCSKLSVADATTRKGSKLLFTVALMPASFGVVSVDFSLNNGTAQGGARCGRGVDFVAANGSLQFAKGETRKQVAVETCNDGDNDGFATLTIVLSRPSNAEFTKSSAVGSLTN